MRTKQCQMGFSLTEFMVYLLLWSIVCCITAVLLISIWKFTHNYIRKSNHQLDIYTALDLLRADCCLAPSDSQLWKIRSSECIQWKNKTQMIRWKLSKKRLKRTIWNIEHDVLGKPSTNIVAMSIKDLSFRVDPIINKGIETMHISCKVSTDNGALYELSASSRFFTWNGT